MIDSFSGKYSFLSNFAPIPNGIEYNGFNFPSVENAYHAAKIDPSHDELNMFFSSLTACSAAHSKKIGKQLPLRENWNNIRVSIMTNLCLQKFSQPEFKRLLLSTDNEELVEGNWWNDQFFGVCKGKGENMLGKILMSIRLQKRLET